MPMTPIPMVRLVPSQAGASMGIAPSGVPMAPMGGTMPSVMYSTAQNVTASGVELEIQGTTVAVGTLRNKSPRDMSVSTGRLSHISFFSCHAMSRVVTPLTATPCDNGF